MWVLGSHLHACVWLFSLYVLCDWVNECGFVFFFPWLFSAPRPSPFSCWLLFKHESLIKCDGLWQWWNPAICYTTNTHTRIHTNTLALHRIRESVVSSARLDAWCSESWRIRCDCCQKNKPKLLQYGENIYVNMRCRKKMREKKTRRCIPLHRWNNFFRETRHHWPRRHSIVVLDVAAFSAKYANGCDKIFCSYAPRRMGERASWRRQIFSIFG